jgi:protein SCO1/2
MMYKGGVAILGLLLVASAAVLWVAGWHRENTVASAVGETTGTALVVSDFELLDQDGVTVRDEDLRGKFQLVFFGFTACPDICPTTLTNITAVLEELGPDAEGLVPLLITVDPQRDTPAVLKEYLTAFDPRIRGLTGSPEQVAAALKSFRVYAARRDLEGGDYTMDHSTFIYLMDGEGAYRAHASASRSFDELVEGIRSALAAG